MFCYTISLPRFDCCREDCSADMGIISLSGSICVVIVIVIVVDGCNIIMDT